MHCCYEHCFEGPLTTKPWSHCWSVYCTPAEHREEIGRKRSRWKFPLRRWYFIFWGVGTSKGFWLRKGTIAFKISKNASPFPGDGWPSLWRIMHESCFSTCNVVRPYVSSNVIGMKGNHFSLIVALCLYCEISLSLQIRPDMDEDNQWSQLNDGSRCSIFRIALIKGMDVLRHPVLYAPLTADTTLPSLHHILQSCGVISATVFSCECLCWMQVDV